MNRYILAAVLLVASLGSLGGCEKLAVYQHVRQLQSPDADARLWAIRSLGELGPAAREAVPALTKIVKEDKDGLFAEAATALGRIGPAAEPAVPVLIDALIYEKAALYPGVGLRRDARGPSGASVSITLGERGRINVRQGWILFGDGRAKMRIHELIMTHVSPTGPENAKAHEALVEALADIGPPAAPALVKALDDYKYEKRIGACRALTRIGRPAMPALFHFLQVRRPRSRHSWSEATQAFREIHRTIQPSLTVTELLGDTFIRGSCMVRLAATDALASWGPRAKPQLLLALGDEHAAVRQAAVEGFGKMGPQAASAVRTLTYMLKDEDEDVRKAVAKALSQIKPDE